MISIEKPKVLIVDDIPANLVAMRRLLSRLDCEVVEANSGNEALSACLNQDFAMLLLDINMPEMDGYEVARLLKDEPTTQHIPIIFVTAAYEDQAHQLRGYQAGAVDYIQKPVDDVILLSKARIFIDLYNHRQKARYELACSEALRKTSAENESRFRQALMDAPIPIMLHAEDGEIILLNKVWAELSGYCIDDIPSLRDWLRKTNPRPLNQDTNEDNEIIASERDGLEAGEYLFVGSQSQQLIWVIQQSTLLAPLADGRQLTVTMANDVTERKRSEETLRLSALVFENSDEGMVVTDADGKIISVNPAFTRVTGYSAEEAIGRNPRMLKSDRHEDDFYQLLWSDLNSKGHWKGEIWNRRKDGSVYPEWLSINTIFTKNNQPIRRVALFSDITQRKQDEELIWRQANFDPLTGLSNRHMFHECLTHLLKESKRNKRSLALLYLDLDEFKNVNDILGHDMGDQLLIQTAKRLSTCVRETDTLSRLGGDEFTVTLGELDDFSKVERVAQAIIDQLNQPFELGKDISRISASIGITLYPDDAEDIETLLKNADQAMYAAKKLGKGRFCFFTPAMQEATLLRMRMANDLRTALTDGQFQLHYQPIVELATGKTRKAEALIRWQHPIYGNISPMDFIPVAEETGCIFEIGEWVFQQAAQQVLRIRKRLQPDFQISINKSPMQFTSNYKTIQSNWLEEIQKLGLNGDGLAVEITEGLLLEINSEISDQLLAYRDANVEIALDDFGTGYSSLSYLQRLDIDYLKIDRSFISHVDTNPVNQTLCHAMIAMAHELNIKVIAEGIETAAEHEFLKSVDCDYGQGYLFSKALPAEEFENWLQPHR